MFLRCRPDDKLAGFRAAPEARGPQLAGSGSVLDDDLGIDAGREDFLDLGVTVSDALLVGIEQQLLPGRPVGLDAEGEGVAVVTGSAVAVCDVVAQAAREEPGLLRHDTDLPAQRLGASRRARQRRQL